MAPDGWMDGRLDGHGQTYIPLPSAGDNKVCFTRSLCHHLTSITNTFILFSYINIKLSDLTVNLHFYPY